MACESCLREHPAETRQSEGRARPRRPARQGERAPPRGHSRRPPRRDRRRARRRSARVDDMVAECRQPARQRMEPGQQEGQVRPRAGPDREGLFQEVHLPPARPFRNYIAWLKNQNISAAEDFWREQLAGFSEPTALNIDKGRAKQGVVYAEDTLELSTDLSSALQALAQQQRITLNTIIQGVWSLILSRYSGQDDVLFGVTLSGRPAELPGVESMVGMFINTLPVRVQVKHEAPLANWLRDLQETQ